MAKTPESLVLTGCLSYLAKKGIYHWRNSSGAVRVGPKRFMRFGKVGSSDILGVLPGGKVLAIECKAKGGRLSPDQRQFLADISNLGGLSVIAYSWLDVDKILRREGYITDPLFHFKEEL